MSGRLSVLRLGVAIGLTTAIAMFITGILSWQYDFGTPILNLMSSIYIGFAPTLKGSFIGAGCGFVDGFICGILIAFFYNGCSKSTD